MLFEEVPAGRLRIVRELDCVSLHAGHRSLSEPLVAQIRATGLRVQAYTVNDSARAQLLAQMGRRHDLHGSHRQTATRHVVHAGEPGLSTTRMRECGSALARSLELKSESFQT